MRGDRFCFLIVILALALAGGCVAKKTPERSDSDFFEKWRIRAKRYRGFSPAAPAAAPGMEEREAKQKDGASGPLSPESPSPRALPTQPVTLKMQEVPLRLLFKTLARAADQNILINEHVKGRLSIHIQNQPWDQVFESLLKSQGYGYEWEGAIIRIVTPADIENNYQFLDNQEKTEAKKRKVELAEPLRTRVIPVEFADAKKLRENLNALLIQDEGGAHGAVMVDEHTNSLLVRASRRDMKMIIELVHTLDRPTQQVLIEAFIVETTQNTARELGLQWGGLYRDGRYWVAPSAEEGGIFGSQETEDTAIPIQDPDNPLGLEPDLMLNWPTITSGMAGLNMGILATKLNRYTLGLQLAAMQEQGKLNILSNPSITTLDNQTANIESGREVPFQTVEEGDVNVEFQKAVLSLEVTPHVINEKTLKLSIATHKDELDFSQEVGTSKNPTILTKKAETNVVLFNGQTTVIGGLSKQSELNSEAGVPVLKDIPLLGRLFRRDSSSRNMDELLIFITPYILEEMGDTEDGILLPSESG